jgi:hypothetical protein
LSCRILTLTIVRFTSNKFWVHLKQSKQMFGIAYSLPVFFFVALLKRKTNTWIFIINFFFLSQGKNINNVSFYHDSIYYKFLCQLSIFFLFHKFFYLQRKIVIYIIRRIKSRKFPYVLCDLFFFLNNQKYFIVFVNFVIYILNLYFEHTFLIKKKRRIPLLILKNSLKYLFIF